MHKKRWIAGGLAAIGVGAALLQVASASFLTSAPNYVKPIIEWSGALVMLGGLLMVIWPLLPDLPQVDYLPRRAKRSDLKLIFELCDRIFDGEVSSLNQMKAWYNNNPNIFWVVERVKRKAGIKYSELLGYFSILPLTKSASELVRKEELPGTNFTTAHISKPKDIPAAYYIGGIAASGRRAKAAALEHLKAKVLQIEENLPKNARSVVFLTRPITKDGVRLMNKYDFHPVDVSVTDPLSRVHMRAEQ